MKFLALLLFRILYTQLLFDTNKMTASYFSMLTLWFQILVTGSSNSSSRFWMWGGGWGWRGVCHSLPSSCQALVNWSKQYITDIILQLGYNLQQIFPLFLSGKFAQFLFLLCGSWSLIYTVIFHTPYTKNRKYRWHE